jgi:signal transduction histidine kinase
MSQNSLHIILEFQMARGDFGPSRGGISVQERFERMFHNLPVVKERITAAGRTVQIHRRAMPGGIVSLYSDITQRKTAERRMAQARNQAELANRAKSEFLANMSHELRTPLNAIVGFADVVSNEVLGPMADKKYLEYIKDIHSSGLHLLSLINDVLDMAKIESGKIDLESERLSVSRVIKDTLLMVREQAQRRNIELVVSVSAADIFFIGDERALKQALLNIVSNAVKFSKDSGRVDVRAKYDGRNGLVLEVEDHGIGMSKEAIERALQPFEQADSSTTRTYGGTGLGLPIANGLAEAHGGTLTVESCEGEGTRVRILLPERPQELIPSDPRMPPTDPEKIGRSVV